jgi:hypothetical protein
VVLLSSSVAAIKINPNKSAPVAMADAPLREKIKFWRPGSPGTAS